MKRTWLLPVLLVVSNAIACGSSAPEAKAPEAGPLAGELVDTDGKPAPKWVTAPATYKKDGEGNKVVCGEGSINGTSNMNMAQTTSQGRARTALARSLETKVVAMLKDYQATTQAGEKGNSASSDEQHVVDATKQITNTTLAGTEVTDTWIAKTSTMHSLVCLNLDKFKGLVSNMKQLDDKMREAVVNRAEKAWDELDAVSSH